MANVLAWIVAVEQYTPTGGKASTLDFRSPISKRALEWAEWLVDQPDTKLLLNVSVPDGSDERKRLDALAPRALNTAQAHLATSAALHDALDLVSAAPVADTLLLLWIGHGVMLNRHRFVLIQDAREPANLRSWNVDSLLQRLRSGRSPALQIGAFDACAQVIGTTLGNEDLGGDGKAQRRQHYYFAATASSTAAPNPGEASLASILLDGLRTLPWPPEPVTLFEKVRPGAAQLRSLAVPWEWTAGSGDLWSRAVADPDADAQLRRAADASGVGEIFFRHLWNELQGGRWTPAALGKALRADRLHALLAELRAEDADAAPALEAAARRVQQVQPWVAPLVRLRLGIAHWAELARLVGAGDARGAPRFAELPELLLWAINMDNGGTRGLKALLQLMVLGAREAERSVPASAKDVQALRALLQADATFKAMLPEVEAKAKLPERPLVLLIELQLPQNGREPVVGNHWLLRDERVEPGPKELKLEGAAGLQLITLIEYVRQQTEHPLRVELLASTELLCGRTEWVSYSLVPVDSAPVAEIDTLVPVCWRWRDRMLGTDPRLAVGAWRQRAREAQQRAKDRNNLSCRFEDDPPVAGDPPDLLGLVARPPGPAEPATRLAGFLNVLVQGHPYMLWPATDAVDVQQLKTCVTNWLATQMLLDLPEGYQRARGNKVLPNLVLFLDEPDRNPYRQMTRLRPLGAAT